MPSKDYFEGGAVSDYGNWNVASDYSRLKIMKQLYLADEYETIATFGFSDFFDELSIAVDTDILKIRGFKRLIKSLMMVIDNSIFAIKKNEKETLKKLRAELTRYWNILPTLFKYKVNQKSRSRKLELNEEYQKALERVIEIKAEINEPLNRYDLIFTHKEDFDPQKAKELIKKRLTEIG